MSLKHNQHKCSAHVSHRFCLIWRRRGLSAAQIHRPGGSMPRTEARCSLTSDWDTETPTEGKTQWRQKKFVISSPAVNAARTAAHAANRNTTSSWSSIRDQEVTSPEHNAYWLAPPTGPRLISAPLSQKSHRTSDSWEVFINRFKERIHGYGLTFTNIGPSAHFHVPLICFHSHPQLNM